MCFATTNATYTVNLTCTWKFSELEKSSFVVMIFLIVKLFNVKNSVTKMIDEVVSYLLIEYIP